MLQRFLVLFFVENCNWLILLVNSWNNNIYIYIWLVVSKCFKHEAVDLWYINLPLKNGPRGQKWPETIGNDAFPGTGFSWDVGMGQN